MRDFSSIAARFEGAFSDYEIHLSTQMSGYFIITKRGGYSSELIGEEVGELVFKDCTKTSDEIRALISAKNPPKAQNNEAQEQTATLDKPKKVAAIDEPKTAFVIEEEKPAFSIECEDEDEAQNMAQDEGQDTAQNTAQESLKPAFEIMDDESAENSGISFEIMDDENSGISFEIAETETETKLETSDENSRISFEIMDDESDENSRISFEITETQSPQSEPSAELPAHHDSQKIFFAQNAEILSAKVVEIEVVIHGYDESCDSFGFEKIPAECEYKYSIKIGELRAIFIATMDAGTASEFIAGFSFKTERQAPKNIEIFVNESSEPVLATTLFA